MAFYNTSLPVHKYSILQNAFAYRKLLKIYFAIFAMRKSSQLSSCRVDISPAGKVTANLHKYLAALTLVPDRFMIDYQIELYNNFACA